MRGHASLPRGPEGTIYEASRFDDNLRIEINPTKIKFTKVLKTSEASSIFHVNYDGMPRVLKVVCTLIISASQTPVLTLSSSTIMKMLGMLTTGSVT